MAQQLSKPRSYLVFKILKGHSLLDLPLKSHTFPWLAQEGVPPCNDTSQTAAPPFAWAEPMENSTWRAALMGRDTEQLLHAHLLHSDPDFAAFHNPPQFLFCFASLQAVCSPTNSLPTAAISCPYWSCSFLHCPVLIPLSRGNPDAWIAMFFPGSLQWKTSLNTYWALSHSPAWLLLPSRHPPTASALPPLTSNLQSLICFVNSLFLEFMALENSTSGLSFR